MIRQRSDILAATNYSGKWVDSAQVWTATSRGYTWGQTKENLSPLLHLSRKRNEYGEKRENENLEPTPKHNNKWQKCVSCQGSTFAVRCTFFKALNILCGSPVPGELCHRSSLLQLICQPVDIQQLLMSSTSSDTQSGYWRTAWEHVSCGWKSPPPLLESAGARDTVAC